MSTVEWNTIHWPLFGISWDGVGGVECMPFTRGLIWTLSRRLVAAGCDERKRFLTIFLPSQSYILANLITVRIQCKHKNHVLLQLAYQ